jgi:trehalose 6-phosphate phosphatase
MSHTHKDGNGNVSGLPVPRTPAGRAGLAALIAQPGRALIGLDFDGTLAPIVDDPARARAAPAATEAISRLAGEAGTVAIITGRPAADAARFAGVANVPGLIVLGHYGNERWEDGALTSPPPPPGLATARAELPGVLAAAGAADGTFVEDKGSAVAVHTRRTASPQAELDRLRDPVTALARRSGLSVEPGKLVLELRPPGSDKGRAIRALAAERSAAAILFCGDDLGDLPAFRAVAQLRAEGTPGLLVCSGAADVPELAAGADLVLSGPPAVAQFLSGLADAFAAANGA